MSDMTIGQLAKAAGVGVETIRYYERRGLIDQPVRPGAGAPGARIRRYGEAALRRLNFIRLAQAAGFTLHEIAELIELDATRDRPRAREMARARIAVLDEEIARLQAARGVLSELAQVCGSGHGDRCPIIETFNRAELPVQVIR